MFLGFFFVKYFTYYLELKSTNIWSQRSKTWFNLLNMNHLIDASFSTLIGKATVQRDEGKCLKSIDRWQKRVIDWNN